jgi:hypothetical protein
VSRSKASNLVCAAVELRQVQQRALVNTRAAGGAAE